MKKLLLILLAVSLFSCGENNKIDQLESEENKPLTESREIRQNDEEVKEAFAFIDSVEKPVVGLIFVNYLEGKEAEEANMNEGYYYVDTDEEGNDYRVVDDWYIGIDDLTAYPFELSEDLEFAFERFDDDGLMVGNKKPGKGIQNFLNAEEFSNAITDKKLFKVKIENGKITQLEEIYQP